MNILLAGGSGFIGRHLILKLHEAEHRICLLTRRPESNRSKLPESVNLEAWDAQTLGPWVHAVANADAVINLAGEGIANHGWTPEQKKKIRVSRIETTRLLVNAITQASQRPKILINASAVGIYGHAPKADITEDQPAGQGFLAATCSDWEEEARKAEALGVRVVLLRFGMVLGKDGGALPKMMRPYYFFLGGPIGSGKQWVSWIAWEDVVGIILFALHHRDLQGPVNVTAPHPVTMTEFAQTLGRALKRPSGFRCPSTVVRWLSGEMADVLLASQKVVPRKLLESEYVFRYPHLELALNAVLQIAH